MKVGPVLILVLFTFNIFGESAGARERAFSNWCHSLANLQNRNLQVAGISFPGVPEVVGPFAFYDFRVSASQTLFDRRGQPIFGVGLDAVVLLLVFSALVLVTTRLYPNVVG